MRLSDAPAVNCSFGLGVPLLFRGLIDRLIVEVLVVVGRRRRRKRGRLIEVSQDGTALLNWDLFNLKPLDAGGAVVCGKGARQTGFGTGFAGTFGIIFIVPVWTLGLTGLLVEEIAVSAACAVLVRCRVALRTLERAGLNAHILVEDVFVFAAGTLDVVLVAGAAGSGTRFANSLFNELPDVA